jgi:two-component system response regulator YesN
MSQRPSYSVLVAEDESLIRENLVKKLAEHCPEFEVVAQAADGREALEAIAELVPDLLITDIRMPVLDGLELIREVYLSHPELPVLIVSGHDEFGYARTALQYGVSDFLLKPVSIEELRAAMSRVAARLEARERDLEREHPGPPEVPAQQELVERVREYLRVNFRGQVSLGALAARFHVNPPYLTRVFKRLTGQAPVRYLRDLRIGQARHLLESRPELEVKEIGQLVGYSDQGYFSRVFKQAAGVSPLEYREGRAARRELDGRPAPG